jgi:ferredoxin, 2Fe-2S
MPIIVIANLADKTIPEPDLSLSLLKNFHRQGWDWLHACGGKGRCTTCRVAVLAGTENMSQPAETERRMRNYNRLLPGERLTCQTYLLSGEVLLFVPEDCRLPHLVYEE